MDVRGGARAPGVDRSGMTSPTFLCGYGGAQRPTHPWGLRCDKRPPAQRLPLPLRDCTWPYMKLAQRLPAIPSTDLMGSTAPPWLVQAERKRALQRAAIDSFLAEYPPLPVGHWPPQRPPPSAILFTRV